MRTAFYIFLVLVAASCESLEVDKLRPSYPVVTAVLEAGSTESEIAFFSLPDEQSGKRAISDAHLRLRDKQGGVKDAVFENGSYRVHGLPIVSGHAYELEIEYNGKDYSAQCEVPPALVLVNLTSSTAHIDPNTMGAPIITVTWNELPTERYSYVLLLEHLDEEPQVIPFAQTSGGQFAALYQSPILNNTITLFDTDFNYYGPHRLSIFAIERGLEHLYFYDSSDLRGLLQTAPGNVIGAHGYFTGVSRVAVDLLIQP